MQLLHLLLGPKTRWVISWLFLLLWVGVTVVEAWAAFDQPDQARSAFDQTDPPDSNRGHATIDFGGQWLMGRMIVEGQGRHLYLRNYLWLVALHAFPEKRYSTQKSDARALMEWLAGTDDPKAAEGIASLLLPMTANNSLDETIALASAQTMWTEEQLDHITAPRIGGALYPPIHALYYAPLALLRPPIAYRVMQGLVLALMFFLGWVAQSMTEGRVWWPVASLFVLMFPGFPGCITLGQNGLILLTVVLVGWWQLMRGRDVTAGLCWGLLAFKPVWAVAFFLAPLVTARWRMAASMAAAGLVQIAMTFPIVGWDSWQNWLHVGQEAAKEYKRQENWIVLSRDLLGIPRRWLITYKDGLANDVVWRTSNAEPFDDSDAENRWDHPLPAVLGWGLWGAVLAGTLFVVWRRRQRRTDLTGLFPAFVLSGAILICYHFMYYDFVVAALPMLLLFCYPWRFLQWRFRALVPPMLLFVMLAGPALNSLCDPSYYFPPWETFVLLLLWAWCGYCLLYPSRDRKGAVEDRPLPYGRGSDELSIEAVKLAEFDGNVRGAHERLADQHGADAGGL